MGPSRVMHELCAIVGQDRRWSGRADVGMRGTAPHREMFQMGSPVCYGQRRRMRTEERRHGLGLSQAMHHWVPR